MKMKQVAIGAAAVLAALAAGTASPARAGGCGTTVKESLGGPAFNGVVPEGEARADESQFLCGGNTILTVQVKNINLPDGSQVSVSLDFGPLGTITLKNHEGTLVTNLGHFAVSNDDVRVNDVVTGRQILIGGFFR